jgi:hypothetical protein
LDRLLNLCWFMLAEHCDHEGRRKLAKQLMEPIPAAVLHPPVKESTAERADPGGFLAAMHGAKGAP